MKARSIVLFAAVLGSLFTGLNRVGAQSTTFTYQGQLQDNGGRANGTYNFTFSLYANSSGGSSVAGPVATNGVGVTNGTFTVLLDFGAGPWTGQTNWLEIGVETNTANTFTTLAPRQQVLPVPYAIFATTASNVTGTLPVAQLTGTIPLAQLPGAVVTNGESGVNISGSFTGNGAGITNVNLVTANSQGAINWTSNSIWGNFVLSSSPPTGNQSVSVAAADVNGDGYIDLISVNQSDRTITVLTNDQTGQFVTASTVLVDNNQGSQPDYVTTADVNGDGFIDVICANFNDNTMTVLTNDGKGGFVVSSMLPVSYFQVSVVAADVNGDGHVDLISASRFERSLTVLTNDGTGGFVMSATLSLSDNGSSVAAADVNGDGHVDLIAATYTGTLNVFTNDGKGGFVLSSQPQVSNQPGSQLSCVTAADVNGDGHVDLICVDRSLNTLSVMTNDGKGGFVLSFTLPVGNIPSSVIAADVNGDGHPDLVCASGTLTVLTNNGTGGFALASTLAASANSVIAGDVNNDGHVDLISANYGSALSVFLNTNAASYLASFIGNGAGLTGLNASQLTGTIPQAQLPAAVVTNGQSGVSIAGTFIGNGGGLTNVPAYWQTVSGTGQTATVNYAYLLTNDSLSTLTLPASPKVGDIVTVSGVGTNGWLVLANAGQTIPGSTIIPAGVIWTPQNSGIQAWRAVASSADGTKLAATGLGAVIYTSSDSGVTWAAQNGAPLQSWSCIASSADGTKLIAATQQGQIWTSGDSGVTWTVRFNNQNESWTSVASSATGTKLVAAAGFGDYLYTSSDSGATWTSQSSPDGTWYSVASSTDGNDLVAGAQSQGIYTSVNAGLTWTAQPGAPPNFSSHAVASSADGTKLVATYYNGPIYTSGDAGVTWVARNSAPTGLWSSIASSADGTKLVAAIQGGQIYTSSDSGVSWSGQNNAPTQSWFSVASSADGSKLVAGGIGGPIYTSDQTTAFSGAPNTTVQFQYVGNGDWQPLGQMANLLAGGLTTNIVVTVPTGTKTLCFTNGVLRAVQ